MALIHHLEKLPYFYETALAGSLSLACQKLYITQPSLSKSINVLEEALGKKLFLRLPRGVQLTQEGEILFQHCHHLFRDLENILINLENPHDPMAGTIKVGTYESIAIFFWPQFLRQFLPKYPHIEFELTTGRSREMQKAVEQGELDMALVIEPQSNRHLEIEILASDTFAPFCVPHKKQLIKDIASAPLIYMPDAIGDAANHTIKRILSQGTQAKRQVYKTSGLETVKQLTLNGLGIGLLPTMVASHDVKKGKLIEITDKKILDINLGQHKMGLIYHSQRKNSPIMQELIKKIRRYKF